jgi:hypothetical protein
MLIKLFFQTTLFLTFILCSTLTKSLSGTALPLKGCAIYFYYTGEADKPIWPLIMSDYNLSGIEIKKELGESSVKLTKVHIIPKLEMNDLCDKSREFSEKYKSTPFSKKGSINLSIFVDQDRFHVSLTKRQSLIYLTLLKKQVITRKRAELIKQIRTLEKRLK